MIFTLVTLALIIYFPVSQALFFPRYKKRLEANPELKLKFYRETIFSLWGIAFLVVIPLIYFDVHLIEMGLAFNFDWWILLTTLLISAGAWYLFSFTKIEDGSYEKIAKAYQEHRYMMPSNSKEQYWMNWVSISAGITEEFIFRAYMFWYFNQYCHWLLSVILLNVAFSLCHVWSGKKNMFNAFLLGLFLSAIFIGSGSLLLAIIVHALVDIYSGHIGILLSRFEAQNRERSTSVMQNKNELAI